MSHPNISNIIPISQNTIHQIQKEAAQQLAKAIASEGSLQDLLEPSLFNPLLQAQRFQDLDKLKQRLMQKEITNAPDEVKILDIENTDEVAERFQRNNPELNPRTLLILKDLIQDSDSPEQIIEKLLSVYPDPALADEALEFLMETASDTLLPQLKEAKKKLNENFGRQIRGGRNIAIYAREFSKQGLGSPTSLRDLYRDITANQRAPIELFHELTNQYVYPKMQAAIFFLLHSLGADLKSKGPSIGRAELTRLIDETRSLQGILGVFRFFQSKAKITEKQLAQRSLPALPKVRFEIIGKLFISLLAEQHINPEKIIQSAKLLDIDKLPFIQALVFSQMYEAIKQISPRYYRNLRHRDEASKSFLDVLEQLNDEEKGKKDSQDEDEEKESQ